MRILSIDTSSATASVAIVEEGKLIEEKFSEDQKTHSEKIVPLVDELLKTTNLTLNDIDEFCVCTGPGSFTGIRIGVALVKGMAQALNKKVVGVSSLLGLINSSKSENVCAIIDALHENVYAQYIIDGNYSEPDCINIYDLIKQLKNKKITFVGNGILKYRDLLEKELDCNFEDNVLPKASDIAIFACENNINFKEPYEIIPVYLRKPQPER